MRRKNALIKLSGNVIDHPQALSRIKELSAEYAVVICTGGGEQINAAFVREEFPIKFGPFGRVTETFRQRQVARDELERNQAEVQDRLAEAGISATVIIPVLNEEIGTVICHINADLYPIMAYNGFDLIEVFTLESRRKKKEQFYSDLWDFFVKVGGEGIDPSVPNRIRVVGFPEKE